MKCDYKIGFLIICSILVSRDAKATQGRSHNNDDISIDNKLQQLRHEIKRHTKTGAESIAIKEADKTTNDVIDEDDLDEDYTSLKLILENKIAMSERKRGWWFFKRNSKASAISRACTFCSVNKLRVRKPTTRFHRIKT